MVGSGPLGAGRDRILGGLVAAAAVALGFLLAVGRTWLCDDAFISFRYADHLIHGQGLVFNAGERVEGFTNLLWTLWIAVGLKLGASAERWAIVWGLAAHAGMLALLVAQYRRACRAVPGHVLPIAALGAAAHVQLATYATGGLETAWLTLLVLAAWFLLTAEPSRVVGAGLVAGLAVLVRPDAVIFAVIGLAYVGWRRRSVRAVLACAAVLVAAVGPATLWRVWYYGDLWPNTWYAKSAALPWWSQGLAYAGLYFGQYWALLAPLPLLVVALARGEGRRSPLAPPALLALAWAGAYAVYVMRVGGDFMHARLLVPVTPLLLVALESALALARPRRPALGAALGVALVAGLALTPPRLPPGRLVRGITDERAFYAAQAPDYGGDADRAGAALRPFLEGLDVRACFFGGQARLMRQSRMPVAIECDTGLTDRVIARRPLSARGRVGHEKTALLEYVLGERRIHFVFDPAGARRLGLDRAIPTVPITFGRVTGWIVHWDPVVLGALGARGARFPDVPASIDEFILTMDRFGDADVRDHYARLRTFYFAHVRDPAREEPIRRRAAR